MNIRKNTSETAAELERIAKANRGKLTPEAVLKNAADKRSPIHDCFTWDDTEAARKHRLFEAACLIRSVKVTVYAHDQDEPKTVRAWINVKPVGGDSENNDPGIYVPFEKATAVVSYKKQMLENAHRDLLIFRNKYFILKELAGVIREIDSLQLALPA